MLQRLIRFALAQRLFVLATAALLAGIGWMAFRSLPIDAFPDASGVQVKIIMKAPGMTPEEVETRIAIPIETEMLGIPHQRMLRSMSKYGIVDVTLDFDDGTDIYWARQQVAERLAGIADDLPPGIDGGMAPITTPLGEMFMFTIEGEGYSLTERRSVLDWTIRPALRTVPGVADVNALGGPDTFTVNDLTGTDVVQVDSDLAGVIGGTAGDAAADTIVVNGTNGDDIIDVVGSGTSASVVGLQAQVNITNSEGANDALVVNALGGNDGVTATSLPAGVIKLTVDGGTGQDTLLGSQGYSIEVFNSGTALLDGLRAGSAPNVVLLDVQMPDLDGIETLRAIRQARPAAQVIMLSGTQVPATIVDAVRLGAVDYVVKPDDPEGFAAEKHHSEVGGAQQREAQERKPSGTIKIVDLDKQG